MSEFRQDPTTREWVILAPERGRRPEDFRQQEERAGLPDRDSSCPFCPGNEKMTPKEVLRVPDAGKWQVRVVPNKYAALTPFNHIQRRRHDGLFVSTNGVGLHEVIIETPIHNRQIFDMDDKEVGDVLRVYRDRYNAIREDSRIRLILIFKNYGEGAGTSLMHPHSQLVATPIVPPYIRRRYEVAWGYYHDTGKCLYCDLRDTEIAVAERVVFQSHHFVVFQPFASKVPFETWIMPKRHLASYGDISEEEIRDLAVALRDTLKALSLHLGQFDFNYVLHTAPVGEDRPGYYLFHIQIIPRLTTMAGFELGSGISISTALPEDTASLLRQSLEQATGDLGSGWEMIEHEV